MFRSRKQKNKTERNISSNPNQINLGIFDVQYSPDPSKEVTGELFKSAGILSNEHEPIITIHLREGLDGDELGPHAARESLALLARYLQDNVETMHPREILGLSNPRLGYLATKLYGFEIQPVNAGKIPQKILNKVVLQDTNPRHSLKVVERLGYNNLDPLQHGYSTGGMTPPPDFAKVVLIRQGTEDFIRRFGSPYQDPKPDKQTPLAVDNL